MLLFNPKKVLCPPIAHFLKSLKKNAWFVWSFGPDSRQRREERDGLDPPLRLLLHRLLPPSHGLQPRRPPPPPFRGLRALPLNLSIGRRRRHRHHQGRRRRRLRHFCVWKPRYAFSNSKQTTLVFETTFWEVFLLGPFFDSLCFFRAFLWFFDFRVNSCDFDLFFF